MFCVLSAEWWIRWTADAYLIHPNDPNICIPFFVSHATNFWFLHVFCVCVWFSIAYQREVVNQFLSMRFSNLVILFFISGQNDDEFKLEMNNTSKNVRNALHSLINTHTLTTRNQRRIRTKIIKQKKKLKLKTHEREGWLNYRMHARRH